MAKDIEKAVRTAQIYAGCLGRVSIKQAQRLYERMIKAAMSIAKKRGMSPDDVLRQIGEEAARRGPICPIPGRDI